MFYYFLYIHIMATEFWFLNSNKEIGHTPTSEERAGATCSKAFAAPGSSSQEHAESHNARGGAQSPLDIRVGYLEANGTYLDLQSTQQNVAPLPLILDQVHCFGILWMSK